MPDVFSGISSNTIFSENGVGEIIHLFLVLINIGNWDITRWLFGLYEFF